LKFKNEEQQNIQDQTYMIERQ